MSIGSATNRNNYTGNGAVNEYDFTYKILDEDDLLVTVRNTSDVETTLVKTTDYTVDGVGLAAGGSITLVNASQAWLTGAYLTTGYVISIRRVRTLTQTTDIRNQGDFYPDVHEDAFDHGVMIAQQQQDEIDRSLKLSESIDPADFDASIPASVVGQANVTFMTNATGDAIVEGPTASEISSAQGYATAAGVSAAAALVSEGNASGFADDASGFADDAAASAVAAAANAAAILPYRDVIYVTNADSPITVADTAMGSVYHVDCTSGAVTINLPSIAALDPDLTKSLVIIKTDSSSNVVTIARDGTDTINGDTSLLLEVQYAGANLVADADGSPDDWTGLKFGASGGGGGSTYINWRELSDAPELYEDASASSYLFAAGLGQELYGTFRVPSSYVLGKPISLNILFWSADTTGTALLSSESTLIVPGTDAITSTTNQRTSTNSAVTLSGSTQNIPQTVTLDLTDTSGEINSVAVSPGDLINIRLFRGTDTSTTDLGFLFNDCEVTIS